MNKKQNDLSQAFTLIELLVVMGIIVLMGALVVPAVSGSLKGTALNQAAQTLVSQFNAAQQIALAKGQTVEMRFIACGDPDSALAQDESDNSPWYVRAVQLYTVQPSTSSSTQLRYTPVTKIEFLPNSIIMDKGTTETNQGQVQSTLSTLFENTKPRRVEAGDTVDNLHPKLARVGLKYRYYRFTFRPDGSTTLDGNKSWYVTLHDTSNRPNADKLTSAPKNFFTVSIDPSQGSTRTFRPQ